MSSVYFVALRPNPRRIAEIFARNTSHQLRRELDERPSGAQELDPLAAFSRELWYFLPTKGFLLFFLFRRTHDRAVLSFEFNWSGELLDGVLPPTERAVFAARRSPLVRSPTRSRALHSSYQLISGNKQVLPTRVANYGWRWWVAWEKAMAGKAAKATSSGNSLITCEPSQA